ncbi:mitochondrial inner membrane protease subunit [Phlyctema vagabunda]|uniref:Mitochondrial inner membrane protease subunit n=1 Tax=Phlyctema vagabunda TaxID=108571 RepID=A0ABR4PIW9_9HELO
MVPSFIRRPFTYATSRYAGHPTRVFAAILKTFALAHLMMDFVGFIVPAAGPSMLPTLEVAGERLLINKAYRRGRDVKVGDLVSFKAMDVPGKLVLKRVVGMSGDYVMRYTPGSGNPEMIQVPQGHVWVVGDNMSSSSDSRIFGPVPMALILGRITAKVFPFSERRWIEDGLVPVGRP